jgi:glycosyltransferase involved in cell wall biosynthesis
MLMASDFRITNGYSIVAWELAKELAKQPEIDLTYFGFQYFQKNPAHEKERELPSNVQVYDAFANENPKSAGFGFDQVADFVTLNKPDVIIIYNDMVVVSTIMEKLKSVPNKKFKVIVYMDQVYLYQKKEYINRLNAEADFVLCFTPYWEEIAKGLGITKPTDFLPHGFNPMVHYPVPHKLCRDYYNLKAEDFIVLSLNRNQPRKRYDILLQAWATFVANHVNDPVKLLIATALQGGWNLLEVYERELSKHKLTLEQGLKHVIFIDNPQQLLDDEINILYNVGDISISAADGGGMELCTYQQAGIGKAQITSFVGGIKDFFNEENAMVLHPKMTFYIDQSRDGCGGEAELVDYKDAVEALEKYYSSASLRKKHGEACRKGILQKYKWSDLGEKLFNIIKKVADVPPPVIITETIKSIESAPQASANTISLDDIESLSLDGDVKDKVDNNDKVDDNDEEVVEIKVKNAIDINTLKKQQEQEAPLQEEKAVPSLTSSAPKKKKKKEKKMNKDELLALREKIDKLLSSS